MTSRVQIGVPVFQGALTLAETLRCIQGQTYADLEVRLSVDAGDIESTEVIRPFLADARFSLVHQPERRGWAGNLEWLMNRVAGEYFCYWQQDDIASHNYVEDLVGVHEQHPGASVTYTDVQWFGSAFSREALASIDGRSPRLRVLEYMDAQHWIPLRGLVRTDHLAARPDWARLSETSPWENGFLAYLAGCGPMLRSEGSLYFKRAHDRQWGSSFESRPLDHRRRDWVVRGRTLLAALNHFSPNEGAESLALVVDRFTHAPQGRFVDYRYSDEPAVGRYLRDWMSIFPNDVDSLLVDWPDGPGWSGGAADAARREFRAAVDRQRDLQTTTMWSFAESTECSGEHLLGFGWSHREPWGVWSEVPSPTLFLPRVTASAVLSLRGVHFGHSGEPARIEWATDNGSSGRLAAACGEPLEFDVPLQSGDRLMVLRLPDAVAPVDIEASQDSRILGFGLTGMSLRLAGVDDHHRQRSD